MPWLLSDYLLTYVSKFVQYLAAKFVPWKYISFYAAEYAIEYSQLHGMSFGAL